MWRPICWPFSQIRARLLTDSKRSRQRTAVGSAGTRNSLRYQATPPRIELSEKSFAFQAFGTWTSDHPVWSTWFCHCSPRPTPLGSLRSSHVPPIR